MKVDSCEFPLKLAEIVTGVLANRQAAIRRFARHHDHFGTEVGTNIRMSRCVISAKTDRAQPLLSH